MDISKIQNKLQKFAIERDWEQFHTPKNLLMAMSCRSFRISRTFSVVDPETKQRIAERKNSWG